MDRAGDIAERALESLLPQAKHAEYRTCMAWARAVGAEIAARTRPVRLTQGTLVVAAENAVWANQLGYMSEDLRERLNSVLGEETVGHIRFVVRPMEGPEEGPDQGAQKQISQQDIRPGCRKNSQTAKSD